jgi:hypothetical protein
MGTFSYRGAVVATQMGPSLSPLGNGTPIVAIRVMALSMAVILPLKSFAAIVGNTLKAQLG